MTAISQIVLIKALDGLDARATATTENIANASTRNYRPWRVKFETALRAAAQSDDAAVERVKPALVRATSTDAPDGMRLDLELATQSETALRYSALVTVLSRQMALDMIAYKGSSGS